MISYNDRKVILIESGIAPVKPAREAIGNLLAAAFEFQAVLNGAAAVDLSILPNCKDGMGLEIGSRRYHIFADGTVSNGEEI